MPQLLHLQNGRIVDKIATERPAVKMLRDKKSATRFTDELFLATLSRLPSPARKPQSGRASARAATKGVPRLFWALLNSQGVCVNH